MTGSNTPVTEDELHAYVDNELPTERRAAVEAWLKAHPGDAAKVASWRAMAERLHIAFDPVADEPVPARLSVDLLSHSTRRAAFAAVAATLLAFVVGGGIGWFAHGANAEPSAIASFTYDALDAHKLYVVEVRHPVEVGGGERDHLQQWLSKRVGYEIKPPELESTGLKLVGGRLLPGPSGPAAFFMYESVSGERFTVFSSRAAIEATQMRYVSQKNDGALFWADRGIGYVVSGSTDKDRLTQVARLVYDQTDSRGL